MNSTSFDRLIDKLPLGVLVVEPDGSVSLVNARALEMLGLPRRVVERGRLGELLPDEAEAIMAPGATITRLEAEDRRLLVEARPIDGTEGPRLVTFRDVTEAGDARKLKETFLHDLLHRMRTPLTAIKSSLAMIHRGAFFDEASDAASLVDAGHVATGNLVRVLDDVRDLFRIDTGLLEDSGGGSGPVDLGAMLEEIRKRFEQPTDPSRQDVTIQTITPEDVVIVSHPEILFAALRRVTENAVAYSLDSGIVTLSVRPGTDDVEITVSDRGPGLGDEEEMHAFDRFYRGREAAVRAPDGLGLGLPIARGFVRHLGGEIELETNPGMGTRVSILLPWTSP